MGQLGIVERNGEIEYLYGEAGTRVFSQSGGDLATWVSLCEIQTERISSVVVQKDFCADLPIAKAQAGYCRMDWKDFVQKGLSTDEETIQTLQEQRKLQLDEIDLTNEITSDTEVIRNQITRENYMMLNFVLYDKVQTFVTELKRNLDEIGCVAPIYFMTGSGYLTDEKNMLKNPVLTWRSVEALELRSAASQYQLEDFIFLKKFQKEIHMMVIKGNDPISYKNHCNFNGYELPPWFVKIKRSKKADLENALTYLNRIYGELPYVCDFEVKTNRMQYQRYAGEIDSARGLFQIPYRKRIFRQVNLSHEKTMERAEEEIRQAMDQYLTRNKIQLKGVEYTTAQENWQYSLERVARLELRVVGYLRIS